MSIENVRFRTEGSLVVLQVLESGQRDDYYTHYRPTETWRDAKVEDLLDAAQFIGRNQAKLVQCEHMAQIFKDGAA